MVIKYWVMFEMSFSTYFCSLNTATATEHLLFQRMRYLPAFDMTATD